MITRFNDVYDFEKEFRAIVAQDVKYDGHETEVKVFIPALMPNIMQGAAGTATLTRPYTRLFANPTDTQPKITSKKITERNYLIAKIDPNSNIDVISDISENTFVKEYSMNFQISETDLYDPKFDNVPDPYKIKTEDISYEYSRSPDALDEYEEEENVRDDLKITKNHDTVGESSENSIEEYLFTTANPNNTKVCFYTDDEQKIYDSSVLSPNSRFVIHDFDDKIMYKSSTIRDGMYYDEAYNENEYLIKEGSNIRCQFLNCKASKLYLKSGPKSE